MIKRILLLLLVIIFIGIFLAFMSWKILKTPTILSEPKDCMPTIVFEDTTPKVDLWGNLLGTRCISY